MTADFDAHAHDYERQMADSVGFAGQEHEYYLRRKADAFTTLVTQHLEPPNELDVLDMGAGMGMMAGHTAPRVGRLTLVDPSLASVAEAQQPHRAAASGLRLPFRDASFDVAMTVNVLHHIERPHRNQAIEEMGRVVRPGGLVVVFEHNPANPLTRLSVHRCEFDDGVELLWPRETRRRLDRAGLDVLERRYVLFTPFDIAWQHRIEERIGWLPLGAQYAVVARRI